MESLLSRKGSINDIVSMAREVIDLRGEPINVILQTNIISNCSLTLYPYMHR